MTAFVALRVSASHTAEGAAACIAAAGTATIAGVRDGMCE